MKSETLIEKLGLKLVPGGFCQWGPTLLAADLLLGGPHPKGVSDQTLLTGISVALRDRQCSRLVILGRLFAPSADPDGDLPGLLVPWRSEILEAEIIWVFPEPMPSWSGILDFLEVKPAPSGSMLGEAELLSCPKTLTGSREAAFMGGVSPEKNSFSSRGCPNGWASGDSFLLPSLGGHPMFRRLEGDELLCKIPWPVNAVPVTGA